MDPKVSVLLTTPQRPTNYFKWTAQKGGHGLSNNTNINSPTLTFKNFLGGEKMKILLSAKGSTGRLIAPRLNVQ